MNVWNRGYFFSLYFFAKLLMSPQHTALTARDCVT